MSARGSEARVPPVGGPGPPPTARGESARRAARDESAARSARGESAPGTDTAPRSESGGGGCRFAGAGGSGFRLWRRRPRARRGAGPPADPHPCRQPGDSCRRGPGGRGACPAGPSLRPRRFAACERRAGADADAPGAERLRTVVRARIALVGQPPYRQGRRIAGAWRRRSRGAGEGSARSPGRASGAPPRHLAPRRTSQHRFAARSTKAGAHTPTARAPASSAEEDAIYRVALQVVTTHRTATGGRNRGDWVSAPTWEPVGPGTLQGTAHFDKEVAAWESELRYS